MPSGKPLFSKCELPIEASGPRGGRRAGLGRSATAALPGEAGAAAAYGGRSVGAPELRRLDARPRACPPQREFWRGFVPSQSLRYQQFGKAQLHSKAGPYKRWAYLTV